MKLSDYIHPGNWLLFFPKKKSFMGNLITKLTFGKVSHAAICVDKDTVFETDGDFFKAKYTPSSKYDGKHILVIEVRGLGGKNIKKECDKFLNAPYSYWDLATNAVFFWLASPIRKKAVELLSTKRFMICSELISRITYNLTGRKELRNYEGITPEDMREIALSYPEEYKFVHDYNSEA